MYISHSTQTKMMNPLLTTGTFLIGCNYWASHAGTAMWQDWQPQIVATDLAQLAKAGLQVLRCFPLWPDFQPITQLYGGGGQPYEVRQGEKVLWKSNSQQPETLSGHADPAGNQPPSGIDLEAFAHFSILADLAHQNNLKLIVGLLTGWMSGRLFIPPALEKLNVLTDPVAILWETRFVRAFVRTFINHPAILAWDLGNECNCMAPVPNAEAAWAWTSAISNAIRVEDPSRPIVSGMHSLDEPNENGLWRIGHQAELTDVLTTHPYPYFTPHCDQEPINTIRNGLHATAQTRWYSDIGKIPSLSEEVGTLGPMFASEAISADYLRMALFSLWANHCHGLLWWCGYDQNLLVHAPYDWTGIERELGLFHADRSPKPLVEEMTKFRNFLESIPQKQLPERIIDAVCILTHGQDQWGIAFTSFILAKQAGMDITFQYADQPLIDSRLYLMPSVSGANTFSRNFWHLLNEKVLQGATLYLSMDDAILSPFKEPFGIEVETREKRLIPAEVDINFPELHRKLSLIINSKIKLRFTPAGAVNIGCEKDGNPALSVHPWGKGRMVFLSFPIEQNLSINPGGFSAGDAQPYWEIYSWLKHNQTIPNQRIAVKSNPSVGVTEHPINDHQRVIVLVNYSPIPQDLTLTVNTEWRCSSNWYGSAYQTNGQLTLQKNDAGVYLFEKA